MTEMLDQIRSLPEQLTWSAAVDVPHIGTNSEILLVGMGGSGIAGDYASVVARPSATRVTVHKGYGPLPPWAMRQRPLVIAASYSGNTEETLDTTVSAWESGLSVATVSTGGRLGELATEHGWRGVTVPSGMQPRAALGYMFGATLRIMEASNSIGDQRLAFLEASRLAETLVEEGSAAWEEASRLAEQIEGRIPIVYGSGPVSSTVAERWKTQLNENAKVPSWHSRLPELDHNEIVGWETMAETTRDLFVVIVLTDRSDDDRIATRIHHTRDLTKGAVPWLGPVASQGSSELARLISLTVVGDLTSWMLAGRLGVDPVAVATIENLKQLLAEDRNE